MLRDPSRQNCPGFRSQSQNVLVKASELNRADAFRARGLTLRPKHNVGEEELDCSKARGKLGMAWTLDKHHTGTRC